MKISALAGNGILRLPEIYCTQELKLGSLVKVFEHWYVADTPVYLLYHKDRYQPAGLKALVAFITEYFISASLNKGAAAFTTHFDDG